MRVIIIFFICITGKFVVAGTVDTVTVYSNSMHKSIKAVVIKPDGYKKVKTGLPVVYLLHGYGGDFANWINRVPELKQYADEYKVLIVCPDGGFSSWYFDSPIDSAYRYETHVFAEVVNYIDQNYKTIPDKKHRAITGLSMGGHGALFLALRHPDLFGAAGSMSGGVDLSESRNRFHIAQRIGDTINHKKQWHDLSVLNLVDNYASTPLKIIVDCGIQDIFINGNRRLHQKMVDLKISHDYIERAGQHNWDYWRNSICYQLFFFKTYFSQAHLKL